MSLTLAELQTRVLSNSFGSGRYTTLSTSFLNEGVADACRQLGLLRKYEVVAHSSTGVVTQPTLPFFKVESVWVASAGAAASGEESVRSRSTYPLYPLSTSTTAGQGSGLPVAYTARRDGTVTTGLAVTLTPCAAAGMVAIVGLARPAVMSASTDVSGLGGDLDAALVAYAKARSFEVEDDAEMAIFWDNRYRTLLGTASLDGQDDGPSVTPGTDGAGYDSLAFGGR